MFLSCTLGDDEFVQMFNFILALTAVSERKKPIQENNVDPLHIYKVDAEKDKNSKSEDCCPCTKPKSILDDDDDAQFQIKFEDYLQNNVFYKK